MDKRGQKLGELFEECNDFKMLYEHEKNISTFEIQRLEKKLERLNEESLSNFRIAAARGTEIRKLQGELQSAQREIEQLRDQNEKLVALAKAGIAHNLQVLQEIGVTE